MTVVGERLSSKLTFVIKYLLPFLFIVPLGLNVIAMVSNVHPEVSLVEKVIYTTIWVLISVYFINHSRSLRHVWLTQDSLVVEKGGKDTRKIPLQKLGSVTRSPFFNPSVIKVQVKNSTNQPETIRFVAHYRFVGPFSEHPAVKKIREAVQASVQ